MKTTKRILHILMAFMITFGMTSLSMLQPKANTERKITYNVSASSVPSIYCYTNSSSGGFLPKGSTTIPSDTYYIIAYFVNDRITINKDASIVKNGNRELNKTWGTENNGYYTTLAFNVDATSDVSLQINFKNKRNFSIRARKIITGNEEKGKELEASLKKRPATYQLFDDRQNVYLEGTIDTAIDSNTNFVHWSRPNGDTQYKGKDDTYIANLPNGNYTIMEIDSGGDLITENKGSFSVWLNSSNMLDHNGRKYYTFTVSDETVSTWMDECNYKGEANTLFYGFYTTAIDSTYNITYNGNGNDQGMMRNHIKMHTNETFNLNKNMYVKSGYTFTGWNTVANPTAENSGIAYEDIASFTVTNENTVLYAQWKKNNIVQHDVYIQDASKEDTSFILAESKSLDSATLAYDASALESIANGYVKQGYSYTGYSIELKEKKQDKWVPYDSSMQIKDGSNIRYILTIDADYKQTKQLSYNIEYWLEGEASQKETLTVEQLVWINETDTTLAVKDINLPTYEGFSFSHYEPEQIPSRIETGSTIKVMYKIAKTPTTPEEPTTPEVPVVPETPTTPEVPVVPETPTTPDTPVAPIAPTTPITPVQPVVVTPVVPVAPVQPITPAQPVVQPDNTIVEDNETPKDKGNTEKIEKEATPKASGKSLASWALVNLICTIITVLLAILSLLIKHKKEEEVKNQECDDAQTITYKRRYWTKLASIIIALVIVILFILTENMTLPMILIDKWTFLMVAISVVQVAIYLTARHWKQQDSDNKEVAYH